MIPGGVDVSIDATGGEYAKGWAHRLEIWAGLEPDTNEMIDECIRTTRKFGAVGIIGDYVGSGVPSRISGSYSDDDPVTNHFNVGSLMERGIRLIECG